MKESNPADEGAGKADRGKPVGSSLAPPAIGGTPVAQGLGGAPASTACTVADGAVVAWKEVAEALVPIVGRSSVTVLYRRCLVSVGIDRTWLPSVTAADLPEDDWTVLHAAVSRQTAKEASEACASLFVAFQDLLGSLIGPALTEQLLHPVSALSSTGSAAQDTFP